MSLHFLGKCGSWLFTDFCPPIKINSCKKNELIVGRLRPSKRIISFVKSHMTNQGKITEFIYYVSCSNILQTLSIFFFEQGLLKVAIDNARAQEKQVQLEKTELKMELFRERELRETLEKQLAVEQKNRGILIQQT